MESQLPKKDIQAMRSGSGKRPMMFAWRFLFFIFIFRKKPYMSAKFAIAVISADS